MDKIYSGVTEQGIPVDMIFDRVLNVTMCIVIIWRDQPQRRITAVGYAFLHPKDPVDDQDYANRLACRAACDSIEWRYRELTFYESYPVPVFRKDLYRWYRLQLKDNIKTYWVG